MYANDPLAVTTALYVYRSMETGKIPTPVTSEPLTFPCEGDWFRTASVTRIKCMSMWQCGLLWSNVA